MNLQPWLPAQDSPEVPVNENFEALGHMAVYAKDATTTTGLTWGYLGGRWGGVFVAAGVLPLAASSTLYVTASRATGAVSASSSDAYWTNMAGHARIYKITTGPSTVIAVEDHRAGLGGVHGIASTSSSGDSGDSGSSAAAVVVESGVNRDIALADVGCYIRYVGVGAKTATFAVATGFVVGQEVHITNRSASGMLTLTGTGITLNAPKGGTLTLGVGDTVTVKFVGSSAADVFGSTENAP